MDDADVKTGEMRRTEHRKSVDLYTVGPEGNQPWIFIGRTVAEAEPPSLCPPDVNSWLTGKDPDAGKEWRWEEKGTTEEEMIGWHHRLNGQESEQALGDGEGQGGLACCSSWGRRVGHDLLTARFEVHWQWNRDVPQIGGNPDLGSAEGAQLIWEVG